MAYKASVSLERGRRFWGHNASASKCNDVVVPAEAMMEHGGAEE